MGRKLRGFTVTPELIASAIQRDALPKSAEFKYAYFDTATHMFVCVFGDNSFESVHEGGPIPIDVGRTDTWQTSDEKFVYDISTQCNSEDTEQNHINADRIVAAALESIGLVRTAAAFTNVGKWYS